MTRAEVMRLAATTEAIWPGFGWPDVTITETVKRSHGIAFEDADRALDEMIREGREYPPSPSLVLRRALDLRAARGEPSDPEVLRLPTPEELAVASRLPGLRARIRRAAGDRDMDR